MIDLKRFRKDNNITQIDLCMVLGINQSYLSQIENGSRPLNAQKINILRDKYGDSINVDGQKWQKTSKTEYMEDGPVRVPVGIVHGPESEYEEDIPEFFNEYPEFEMPNVITNDVANDIIEMHLRHKSNQ